MEWVKLAAVPAYYADASLLRAGEAAEVLFCRALAHCGSVESRGKVSKAVLPLLVATKAQQRAAALVREGLWVDKGDHYLIRSWDRWQDAHDIAAEKRRKDRERKRQQRRQGPDVRGTSAECPTDSPRTVQACHSVEGEGEGDREVLASRDRLEVELPDGPANFEEPASNEELEAAAAALCSLVEAWPGADEDELAEMRRRRGAA